MNDPEIHSNTWEWDMVGPVVAVAVLPQLPASRLHQRDRDGRRPRLRRHPRQPRPGVEAGLSVGPVAGGLLAIVFEWGIALHDLYRRAGAISRPRRPRPSSSGPCSRKMGRQAAKDYLFFPALSGRRFLPDVPGESRRRRLPQRVGIHRDRLRALRRRRREIHSRSRGERDEAGMVSAADAGHRELRCRPRHGVHEWKPLLPDRAPPVP